MMNFSKLMATLLAGFVAFGTLSSRASAEISDVKIAQQQTLAFLPSIVMQQEKLLEKHLKAAGLGATTVTWATFAGGNTAIDGILSGSLQFAFTGVTPFITLWAKTKGAVKGVAATSAQPEYLNTRNPNIKSLEDFTSKDKIGVPAVKVSTQAVFLQMAAAKLHGDTNYTKYDAITVSMSQPDATTAVLSGHSEVNTAFVSQPYTYILRKNPEIRTVLNTFDLLGGPATLTMVWTTKDVYEKNPKTYAAFLAAYDEALGIINKDKRRAAQIYLQASKGKLLSVDDIVAIISDPQVIYTATPQNMMKSVEFMHKIGSINVKPASWKDMWFPNVHNLPGS
jgi:NitT/TauT family transport system substrate-binding protein